jgi:PhnB protein
MQIHPYLNFGGTCREAMTRYQQILGGRLDIMSMADMPGSDVPAEQAHLVMHAALMLGSYSIMASDDPSPTFEQGRSTYINVTLDSVDEAERVFRELADGGAVEMELTETFWTPRFGMCADRFGVRWMVNMAVPAIAED